MSNTTNSSPSAELQQLFTICEGTFTPGKFDLIDTAAAIATIEEILILSLPKEERDLAFTSRLTATFVRLMQVGVNPSSLTTALLEMVKSAAETATKLGSLHAN